MSESDNTIEIEKQIIAKFINDYLCNKFDDKFLFHKYGEDTVRLWLSRPDIVYAITEARRKQAEEGKLQLEQINNFKAKAADIIAKALNGDYGSKEQVRIANLIFAGEFAYAEAKAKAMAEKDSSIGKAIDIKIMVDKDDENL